MRSPARTSTGDEHGTGARRPGYRVSQMNGEQADLWVVAGGAVALLLLVICLLLWRSTRGLGARIDELERATATQVASPSRATEPTEVDPSPYVIYGLDETRASTGTGVPSRTGSHAAPVVTAKIDGTVFADIVARETVIRTASLAHGLRRALSAETRNRIRFEMKREVKRSRKQRRADLKAAHRDLQARARARPDALQDGEDAA